MRQAALTLTLVLTLAGLAQAEVKTKTIPYMHNGQQFEGVLAWDDAVEGKRPGVLVVHEWWGLDKYAQERAKQLAKMGYVAFAADMYGKGKSADHPMEASKFASEVRMNVKDWQARATKALELLKSQEQTDPERLAAIGYCFGGSTALQLAYTGADLDAVVSFHGAPQTPTEEQAKAIKAKILIAHGAADTFIPDSALKAMTGAFDKAMVKYTLKSYEGAQHSFTVPESDARNVPGLKYNKAADEQSWKDMQELFGEAFKK